MIAAGRRQQAAEARERDRVNPIAVAREDQPAPSGAQHDRVPADHSDRAVRADDTPRLPRACIDPQLAPVRGSRVWTRPSVVAASRRPSSPNTSDPIGAASRASSRRPAGRRHPKRDGPVGAPRHDQRAGRSGEGRRRHPVAVSCEVDCSWPVSASKIRAIPSLLAVTTCSLSSLNAISETRHTPRENGLKAPVGRSPDAPGAVRARARNELAVGAVGDVRRTPELLSQRMDAPPALSGPDAHDAVGASRHDAAVVRSRSPPSRRRDVDRRATREPHSRSTRRTPSRAMTAARDPSAEIAAPAARRRRGTP